MNLSEILSSSCRRRILKALSGKKEITMMKLVQTVNSTYNEVNRKLCILEHEKIITQRYASCKRIIRLNLKNERTLVLLRLLIILENSVDLKHFRKNLRRLLENGKENHNYIKH